MGHLMLVTGYWCRKVITSRRQSDAIVDNVQTILGYTYTNLNVLIEAPNAPGSGMKMTVVRLVILKKENLTAAGIGEAVVSLLHV